MSMEVTLHACVDRRFSIPDRSSHLPHDARRHPRRRAGRQAPVAARGHADQLGEAGSEGTQRGASDLEADLSNAEVATTQQRHCSLDAARHKVAVRRLAVSESELAAEMSGRHIRVVGKHLDVQRIRVIPVDPVANSAQTHQVPQVRLQSGSAGHQRIVPRDPWAVGLNRAGFDGGSPSLDHRTSLTHGPDPCVVSGRWVHRRLASDLLLSFESATPRAVARREAETTISGASTCGFRHTEGGPRADCKPGSFSANSIMPLQIRNDI